MYKQLIFCYQYVCVTTLLMTKSAKQDFLYGSLSSKDCRKAFRTVNTTGRKTGSLPKSVSGKSQCKEYACCPYRKPTQVNWSSRPRYTCKDSLRNSAKKLSVSFTICSAHRKMGCNKSFSTDCLAKTQAPANQNMRRIGAEACPVLVS